jgi:hypothetical protein
MMDQNERQRLLDQLDSSRDRLLELVEGLSVEQWKYRAAEDRWSIADCIEHVTLVEDRMIGVIETKVREGKPDHEKRDSTQSRDAQVSQLIPDRSIRRQAPEPVRPTGRWPHPDDLLAQFQNTRNRTRDFAASTNADLRGYFHPHGAFGDLDLYQWLLVLSLHGVRHAEQIKEVKFADGFPPSSQAVPS